MPGSPRGGANLAPPTITSSPLPPRPSLLCVSCAPDRDGCEEGDQGEVRGWGLARTPATKKGRGTSGGEGARREAASPPLGEGFAGSPVALGEGAGGPDGEGQRRMVSIGGPEEMPGEVRMADGGWGGRRPEPQQEYGRGEQEDGESAAPAYREESRVGGGLGWAREGGRGPLGVVSLRDVPGAGAAEQRWGRGAGGNGEVQGLQIWPGRGSGGGGAWRWRR